MQKTSPHSGGGTPGVGLNKKDDARQAAKAKNKDFKPLIRIVDAAIQETGSNGDPQVLYLKHDTVHLKPFITTDYDIRAYGLPCTSTLREQLLNLHTALHPHTASTNAESPRPGASGNKEKGTSWFSHRSHKPPTGNTTPQAGSQPASPRSPPGASSPLSLTPRALGVSFTDNPADHHFIRVSPRQIATATEGSAAPRRPSTTTTRNTVVDAHAQPTTPSASQPNPPPTTPSSAAHHPNPPAPGTDTLRFS